MTTGNSAEETFLVLAPTGRDAPLTQSLLEKSGLHAALCSNLAELCERFERDGAAGLLIAEEVFSHGNMSVLRDALVRQSAWSDVPIIIFTATTGAYARARASSPLQLSALGNVILLERPLQPISMLSAARSALRARRRQYDARAELLAQQRAVRERDQFLAMLGHELRNPLSAIGMAVKLDAGVQASKYHDIMERQLKHLTRLVDDLLDVARVTSGKIVLRKDALDLVALTRRCIHQLRPSVAKDTTLELQEPGAPVWISADAVRIEQVVNNLVNNAIKYTAAGGAIRVQIGTENEEAVLSIRDSGVGLAPHMLDRVFELFTQVEGSLDRAQGGMGIGLTLVRNLVELHSGSVSVSSEGLGKGSEFTVRLPLQLSAADSVKAVASAASNAAQATPPTAAEEVMIVEDNEDSRELLAAILTQRGYRVSTAEDGPSGIESALAQRPQVLLVDIGLPGVDGYGLAREVRSKLGRDVYLVALTGYGQPQDRSRALDAGFDVHMTKPVDIDALERLLAARPHAPLSA